MTNTKNQRRMERGAVMKTIEVGDWVKYTWGDHFTIAVVDSIVPAEDAFDTSYHLSNGALLGARAFIEVRKPSSCVYPTKSGPSVGDPNGQVW